MSSGSTVNPPATLTALESPAQLISDRPSPHSRARLNLITVRESAFGFRISISSS